jgi:N-acetyl-D-muramate 6-phosphate phosphatase
MPSAARTSALLLDLDGTLIDTAPDLVAVLNRVLREDRRAPLPYALARNEVSRGAIGLLRRAYGDDLDDDLLESLRSRFLEAYATAVCVNSIPFIALQDIIDTISTNGMRWGIVTNKPRRYTVALLEALGIDHLPECTVSGDDLTVRKPDPAPLRLAAERLGVPASACVYVGDAPGDIVAGRAAAMRTIAAAYGYIRPGESVAAWRADAVAPRPRDVLRIVGELVQ